MPSADSSAASRVPFPVLFLGTWRYLILFICWWGASVIYAFCLIGLTVLALEMPGAQLFLLLTKLTVVYNATT